MKTEQKKLVDLFTNGYKAYYHKQHTKPLVDALVEERKMTRSAARKLARATIKRALWEQRTSKTPQVKKTIEPTYVRFEHKN